MNRRKLEFFILIEDFNKILKSKKISLEDLKKQKCGCGAVIDAQDYVKFKVLTQNVESPIAREDVILEFFCKKCVEKLKKKAKN